MADAELKPCPFCGGAVELERTTGSYEKMHGQREWWGVVCRNTINVGGTCAIQQVPSASKEAAVERWNCRATHPTEAGAPTAAAECVLPEGFEALHLPHDDSMTAEWNAKNRFIVRRIAAPFCGKDSIRQWAGPTLPAALETACAALGLAPTSGRESAAPAVAGFTTAPIHPTKEMIEAAENTGDLYRMGSPNLWADVWRNMLRAAPAAPVREGDREQKAKVEHITMNGHQLKQALELAWPDGDADPSQGGTVVLITRWPAGKAAGENGELVEMPAGLYLEYDDLPNEGMTYLPEEPEAAGKDNCTKCGQPWGDHDFGVPEPYCPDAAMQKGVQHG